MYFIVCLLVLLPLQALAASLSIPAEPYREEIGQVRRYNVAYGFYQTASGEFQIQVTVRYRPTWSRVHRFKHFVFRLQDGTIVQHDPKTLMLRLDNRELSLAGIAGGMILIGRLLTACVSPATTTSSSKRWRWKIVGSTMNKKHGYR
jgi:hypothetical protein